jgi:hypothetical protein
MQFTVQKLMGWDGRYYEGKINNLDAFQHTRKDLMQTEC